MESTRPIRALTRGLDALTVLNLRDGATVSEVAHEIRLPRTTVYRILETLCDAGFVFRDVTDDRYRLTIMVRGLSEGFDDQAWVTQIAGPLLHALGHEIIWPISIATLSTTSSGSGSLTSASMLVRETTDHSSVLAMEKYSAGLRAPLLTSAAGRAYLAFCPLSQRESLIEQLSQSTREADKPARAQRAELQRLLTDIKTQGYATSARMRRLVEEVSLSVPVLLYDRVLAVLTVRFATAAVPLKTALERFLPKLCRCAAKMSTLFSEQQAEARSKGVPQVVA